MIYLDYNATTPVDEEVLSAMLPYFTKHYGNAASSTHLLGWDAKEAVDIARKQIADAFAVSTPEIIFTSGATEAVNLAIKGIFEADTAGRNHVITVKTEHKAVLDTCLYIEQKGADISYLNVDKTGIIDINELKNTITEKTLLVVIMLANNETGVLQPIQEIAKICKAKNVFLCSDATQAVGKISIHPQEIGIDLMAFSSHKTYGPKGVGGLYVKSGITIQEQQNGGQHERKRRSGTLNVPAIVGFGKAIEIATQRQKEDAVLIKNKRNHLEINLLKAIDNVSINGNTSHRMPHVTNLLFKGVLSESLMLALSTHIALSAGSACNSATVLPSYVLTAMGLSAEDALSSIRFSLGRQTTDKDIEIVIQKVVAAVNRIRG